MLSTVIFTDGAQKNVEPSNGTDFSLEELRGFVGGHIELVRLSKSQVMVVNEEGKVYDLPQNEERHDACEHSRHQRRNSR